MKAVIKVSVKCDCGVYMCEFYTDNDDYYLACYNVDCYNFNKKYKSPTIELETVDSKL